jgi:hypothetical protein
LHENLKPKGIDWDITSGQTVEKQNSAALEQNDKPRREAILNSIANSVGPAERSLGIYELTPTEFRVYTGGWVPFKVKDNHLVPDPLAPSAKRPKSFTEKLGYHRSTRLEENPGVYTRVERSLKDQVDTSLTPAAIDPNQVSNSAPVSSPKLQDLRQQRLKLAQERMDLLRQVAQMQPQVITQHDLAVAAQTLVDSKLALAKDKKERLQALDEQLQLVKQIADSAEQRYKAGSVLKSDVIAAQLRRLELEIQIEELKAQP